MSMQKIIKNKYFEWINILIIGFLFLMLMFLDINDMVDSSANNIIWIKKFRNPYIWLFISTYVVFVIGTKYINVYKNIVKNKNNMDLLIALAIHVSYLFSLIVILIDKNNSAIWEPIGLLFAFDSIGKKIEKYIFNKNDFERQKLETLKKQEVFLKNGKKINIKDVNINDIIVFKKNEIIQFDGIIENGKGFLDTSNINGESNPHFVKKNSNIISGTKVLSEKIFVKVKINFKNSTLNKLILLIDKTSKVKSKIQNLANKIYKIFIPSVLFITIFIWIIWLLIGKFANLNPSISNKGYIYNSFLIAVSILAISCPCAMTMTAPLINYVSSQSYWKANIIFNKINDLEKISKINFIVLDKTGTITTNQMIIQEFGGQKKYHQIAASLEKISHHPIAISIFKKFNNNLKINDIKEIFGKGVEGIYENQRYLIKKTTKEEIKTNFKKEVDVGTYIGLYSKNKLLSYYILESKIKKNAHKLVKYLKEKNIKIIILSGDNEEQTKEIAKKLEIDYKSNQLPMDKARYIQELQKNNNVVCMVGDGLNDSIAIKYSDVSITFASGSNISNSYSSVSLLNEDLNNIIYLNELSKKTKNNYIVAIMWAIGFNLIFVPFASLGLITPWMSASIMIFSNLILFFIIFLFSIQIKALEKRIYNKKLKKSIKSHNLKLTKKDSCCKN